MIPAGSLIRHCLQSLLVHRLRTSLTTLGIIIGVAAVISMLSIGEGAKREAMEQLSILGINNILVRARAPESTLAGQEGFQRSAGLNLADADNIREFEDLVANVVPMRFETIGSVRHGAVETPARIVSTFPFYILSSSIEVEQGRFLTSWDMRDLSQVCVLGSRVKRALFAFEDPLGQVVRVGELDFTVVGVMADKYIGRGKIEGLEMKNLNEDVYIPYSTALKKIERPDGGSSGGGGPGRFPPGRERAAATASEIDQLIVTVRGIDEVRATTVLLRRLMERRHAGVPDYEIVVPESLLRQSQKTQRIFNIVMGAIAGLSLLVGGIGIMNIMLATVFERTGEIGVRRAVGATARDILLQFLFEAVAICLVGCLIGVASGLLISRGISLYAGWPTVVSVPSVILAVGVSTIVGLVFGVYPARKAAGLDVVDALRYE